MWRCPPQQLVCVVFTSLKQERTIEKRPSAAVCRPSESSKNHRFDLGVKRIDGMLSGMDIDAIQPDLRRGQPAQINLSRSGDYWQYESVFDESIRHVLAQQEKDVS